MFRKPPFTTLLLGAGIFLLVACEERSDGDAASGDNTVLNEEISTDGQLETLKGKLYSIPSPIQTAILLKSANVAYDGSLLNPLENRKKYINLYQKAMNVGIYGADLAYLSGHNNAQLRLDYFETVKALMDELEINANIDASVLERVAKNIDEPDSLYVLNAQLYRAADSYLKENNQDEEAGYILIGGWIESLHLILASAKENQIVRQRVGEQKMAIKSVLNLLEHYQNEQSSEILNKLRDLQEVFAELDMTYTFQQPITDSRERKTYINSKTTVQVSDAQLDEISFKVEAIRKEIIR